MERVFGALCATLFGLPGETFVDEAARWMDALTFMAALKPRNEREWLMAADITMKQVSAVHSLLMRKRKGVTATQRLQHGQDFLDRAKAMQDARLHYDLLRSSRAS